MLAGVLAAMAFAAAPFAFKQVRQREEQVRCAPVRLPRLHGVLLCAAGAHAALVARQVAAMRDASYAKDDARNARLQGPKRPQSEGA